MLCLALQHCLLWTALFIIVSPFLCSYSHILSLIFPHCPVASKVLTFSSCCRTIKHNYKTVRWGEKKPAWESLPLLKAITEAPAKNQPQIIF